MGLPVHDDLAPRRFPWVNMTLILLNLLAFAYEASMGNQASPLVNWLALYPAAVLRPSLWISMGGWPLLTLFTSTFVHASWMHVIGNMLFLYVFGDNVEDILGHARYLLFYLLGGAVAGLAQSLTDPNSLVATIGASGAVAAVMGAYIINYPTVRVITLIPSLLYLPVRLPAWVVLGLWWVLQLTGGITPLDAAHAATSVAFWAHISGFLAGAGLVGLLRPTPRASVR